MNSRLLISIALPVTAFTVTVAILLWQQHPESPVPAVAQAAIPAQYVRSPMPPAETEKPVATQSAETNPAPPSPSPNPDVSDLSQSVVPVRLNARGHAGQSDVVATLLNMTAEDLDVTITGVSAKTHMRSVVDVTLHPHERRNLAAAGLDLASGDQVTVQSPPFRDLVVQAQ